MFQAGSDDFVSKPVSADDLVARVLDRIERSRGQTERSATDLSSGLADARTFAQDASRLLGLAHRESVTAALALVELQPPNTAERRALGRLLRQVAPAED